MILRRRFRQEMTEILPVCSRHTERIANQILN